MKQWDLELIWGWDIQIMPIAGCPRVSELEPKLTDQLTLKGNRARLLHVPLWHHTYYTSTYLIDDITGELYACHQDELIAIKEQGYLQKEIAEEKYLDSQRERRVVDLPRGNNPQLPMNITKDRPKLPWTPTPDNEGVNINIEASESLQSKIKEQNRKTIEVYCMIIRKKHIS